MLSTQKYGENLHVNYSPFGAILYGRNWSSEKYRYGFNGMEKDDEVKGAGNSYDYVNRFYDNRLGRFLSVDPLASSFPWYTPYQFAGNKPIVAIDLDGLEEYMVTKYYARDNENNLSLSVDFKYIMSNNRRARNGMSADRKADIIINGNYSRSEMSSFEGGSLEHIYEVHREPVYRNRIEATQSRRNMGDPAKILVTLKESMEDPSERGDGMVTSSVTLNSYKHFNGLYDNYTFNQQKVYFGTNESALDEGAQGIVEDIVNNLVKHKELTINISGHTSMSGGETYNSELSVRRVQSVKQAIIDKLTATGMSESEISNRITSDPKGRTEAQQKGQSETSNASQERRVTVTYDINE